MAAGRRYRGRMRATARRTGPSGRRHARRRDAVPAQASSGRSLKRIEMSTAVTSLFSAPTEMRSTPVSA